MEGRRGITDRETNNTGDIEARDNDVYDRYRDGKNETREKPKKNMEGFSQHTKKVELLLMSLES